MFSLLSALFAAKTDLPEFQASAEAATTVRRKRRTKEDENNFSSYYNRPVIKKPHWVWPVWTYFWVGGIVSGASAISTIAHLFGDKERDHSIVRAGRYISMAGMLVSPVLLIIDLQRPERFHHMLRVLKLRSPLSVGTYILTSTGLLTGLNTARQMAEDGLLPRESLPGKLARLAGNDATQVLQGLDGMALGSYTGVLLSATAVPLWADTAGVLSSLFLSSSFSTGAASISLVRALSGVPTEELHRLDRIEQGAILAEMGLIAWSAATIKPEVRAASFQGIHAKLMGLAIGLGQVGPLLLQLAGPKKGKAARLFNILSSLMVLAGGFLLRVAVVEAGKASADSSDAYHATTRGDNVRATPAEQARRYSH